MLRVAGEAINNAVRHGGARTINLAFENDGCVRLVVRDDGCGFDPEAALANGGFGLTSMRERAEALGGNVSIRAAPGAGATVDLRLP